jgi:hypothetical protein
MTPLSRFACFVPLVSAGALAVAADVLAASAPIEIGSRLELLVDRHLIAEMRGVDFRLHEPRPAETSIVFDRDWEGNTSAYASLMKTESGFRMYYRGHSLPSYALPGTLQPGERIVPEHDETVCFVESRDGVRWERTNLGLFEFNGSRENNIVWMGRGAHNFYPFRDGNPDVRPDEAYKAIASFRPPSSPPPPPSSADAKTQYEYFQRNDTQPALYFFTSPDGIRWKKASEAPIIRDGAFDSLNVAFWDGLRKEYVALYRDFENGVRSFKIARSPDFRVWTKGEWADFGMAPRFHLYTVAAAPYERAPHLYLGIPRRYLPWRTYFREMDRETPGVSDALFMSSRDGVAWTLFPEAFINPGPNPRNWSHRANTPLPGFVQTSGSELSLYIERDYTFASNRVERMTLRMDGFVSLRAGYPGGEWISKPLVFRGSELFLNYATSANGSIRIEIQDAVSGQPIPGFVLEDSPTVFGDRVSGAVDWGHQKGMTDRSPLRALQGRAVRLRFVMKEADLFSFQFR